MFTKNQRLELYIEDMTEDGSGVGKADGFPFFVKDTVIGDRVEAVVTKLKKSYGYGRMLHILTPSPSRIPEACPSARRCGGCQLQAMSYERQLEFKREKVANHLKRIGGLSVPVEPVIGMEQPFHYRNKTQVPVGVDREGRLRMGFYASRSHEIVEQANCLLGGRENDRILETIRSFLTEYRIPAYDETSGRGLVRHILIRRSYETGEYLVCIVINGKHLPRQELLVERLRALAPEPTVSSVCLNINEADTNVILGEQVVNLFGPGYLEDSIGQLRFRVSPQSFFQVNPEQTRKLYETALSFAALTGTEQVWDLYCGIGTISLFLAQKAGFVRGVEIVAPAVRDAEANAVRNGLSNTRFYVGKAEEVLPRVYEEENCRPDVIVVDPPRKGCEPRVLDTMLAMQPSRIVYVSCDSATLARDLKHLTAGGYEVKKVQPVDMFPWTVSVETVCLLSKLKSTQHIEVEVKMDEMDLTAAEKKATYDEIKAYVLEHSGLKVSSLYIAQVKQKCGMIERGNYNKAKSEDAKQPQCPAEKKTAIMEALRHFEMI
ncbi:MAG: 23S rRNA (uracil(1939)-C(5))-methyltransferase RlmD [Lachnospiraceae bacterium]|nr:23S rRNA (uracil(1939)-C(5))-methyltransferase RlmD [Lachnospiraceae bacterium]